MAGAGWKWGWLLVCLCACVAGAQGCLGGEGRWRFEPVTGLGVLDAPLLNETSLRRVINGERAHVGDVPYLVSMRYAARASLLARFTAFCGGTLVTPRKAISAAHCFEKFRGLCSKGHVTRNNLKKVRAVMGSVTNQESEWQPASRETTQFRKLRNVFYPDSYKFPKNDIAVVTMVMPFQMTRYVATIPLATSYSNYAGTCLAAGFGRTKYNVTAPTKFMYMANLQIMPQQQCNSMSRMDTSKFVCTDTVYNDVAQGDSGGPLVCGASGAQSRGMVVGATSAGLVLKKTGKRLTLFTRVSSHRRFVRRSRAPAPPAALLAASVLVLVLVLVNL